MIYFCIQCLSLNEKILMTSQQMYLLSLIQSSTLSSITTFCFGRSFFIVISRLLNSSLGGSGTGVFTLTSCKKSNRLKRSLAFNKWNLGISNNYLLMKYP